MNNQNHSYAYYKGILQTKLEALTESDTDGASGLFYEVVIGENATLTGYPSAVITNDTGQGQIQNTMQNEEEWQIAIRCVHQYTSTIDNATAEANMDNVVDRLRNSFDTDIDLGGTCVRVKVVPIKYTYTISEQPFIFAEFTISIVDLVNRF